MKNIIVGLSLFCSVAKAFSVGYGVPLAPLQDQRSLVTTSQSYGVPVRPEPIVPLETIDIPEQGPGVLIPQFDLPRQQILIGESYGAPAKPIPIAPLETIDIPEQGPGLLIPQFDLSRQQAYGVPFKPAPIAPLETIDIPEQGPGVLVPQFDLPRQQILTSESYGVPVKPAPVPVKPFKPIDIPLETIDIPDQGPAILIPSNDLSRTFLTPDSSEDLLYNYRVDDTLSTRQEMRHANGLTRGFYSYIDANGQLQRVDYIADPIHGYRTLNAIPLVQDTEEVARAKAEFFKAYEAALNQSI